MGVVALEPKIREREGLKCGKLLGWVDGHYGSPYNQRVSQNAYVRMRKNKT